MRKRLLNEDDDSDDENKPIKRRAMKVIQLNPKTKTVLVIVLIFAAIIYLMNFPIFSSNKVEEFDIPNDNVHDVIKAEDAYVSPGSLKFKKRQFYLDGQPLRILSGAVHYFRIPEDYWDDILKKAKAAGLNTIDTWLLKDPDMVIRSNYKPYQDAVDRWFGALIPKIKDFQRSKGGPIIAVQVENEFGHYSDEIDHLLFIKKVSLFYYEAVYGPRLSYLKMSSKSVLEHFTVPDDFQNGNTFKGKCMHCGTLISGSYKVTSNFVTHMKDKLSQVPTSSEPPCDQNSPPCKRAKNDDLFSFMPAPSVERKRNPSGISVSSEMDDYLSDNCIDMSKDPLLYWHSNCQRLPRLAKLAVQYLAIPATSAPVERLFSTAGKTFRPERCRLADGTFEKLMMVKLNRIHISQTTRDYLLATNGYDMEERDDDVKDKEVCEIYKGIFRTYWLNNSDDFMPAKKICEIETKKQK
ncbi:unnamed protein product [Mytilus edulis]|uniref:Beta-galactosidase n=1 Tax=Mytilus edulis TaxID=6550 RepID=A0A8S3SSM1_MYTED|nr:unnamed protein product [Mytilus edulis]